MVTDSVKDFMYGLLETWSCTIPQDTGSRTNLVLHFIEWPHLPAHAKERVLDRLDSAIESMQKAPEKSDPEFVDQIVSEYRILKKNVPAPFRAAVYDRGA